MNKSAKKLTTAESVLECYEKFHDSKYLELDPLLIVRKYLNSEALEEVALIGALFAFGAVGQVQKSLNLALAKSSTVDHSRISDEKKLAEVWAQAFKGF